MKLPLRAYLSFSKFYFLLSILLFGLTACSPSWSTDDSHYVSLAPKTGYYIVRPDSGLFRQLDLFDAPWIDTADRLRHGYGADVLAFRFDRTGTLMTPPSYIAQESVNILYTRKLARFIQDESTTQDVENMFGRGYSRAPRPDGFMYYYALPIYNAAEDWGGRH